ncbi:MAG: NAD(P)-dependent alcohol dehydrogenase [Actinomycetia bacterium]|nr:NAD(P)-dependent alcohol dehydrogenase [Actinomycetes bacterium]
MQAMTQERYGSAARLGLTTLEIPTPSARQVLIEVAAAGVDRGVWHLMTGQPYLIRLGGFGLTKPKQPVPGLDVAGRVVAVGSDVTRFAVGDDVFGIGSGTFAEYAVAGEDKLVARPASLSFAQAAALAISGGTADQALHKVGKVEADQKVLVLGASGGVGSYAVQIARAAGAEVTAVASGPKADFVRSLGANHVVDYTTTDVTAEASTYDLIIDIGGRNKLSRLRRVLAPTGTLVIVGGEDGGRWTGGVGRQLRALALSPFVRQRLTTFIASEGSESIERLVAAVEAGEVVPAVDRSYRLDEVPAAVGDLESGRIRGKAVVEIRPNH